MINIIEGTGIFFWPLLTCSFIAVFIIIERIIALRQSRIIPKGMSESFIKGDIPQISDGSVSAKIINFYRDNSPDTEQLKAYARLEVSRMERGLFLLDIVVTAAPLIGLLGTVTGLIQVFANVSPDTGMPDPDIFVRGIALALTTTMLGLSIAIPALVGNSYLNRRIDFLEAQISVGVERLIDLINQQSLSSKSEEE